MHRIEATLPPASVPAVLEALEEEGFRGATVTEVLTDLVPAPPRTSYRGTPVERMARAVRVEVVVPEEQQEVALAALARAVRSAAGRHGSAHVTPVAGAVRVRTGQRGPGVLAG